MNQSQQWEYRVIESPLAFDPDWWTNQVLNPAGAEGWEVVAALPVSDKVRVVMKRPKEATSTE